MGMEAIVALVVTATQVGKSWIKSWFKISDDQWQPWFSVAISLVVAGGVVVYDALKTGAGVNFDLVWTALAAFALANGAKKVIASLKPAK